MIARAQRNLPSVNRESTTYKKICGLKGVGGLEAEAEHLEGVEAVLYY